MSDKATFHHLNPSNRPLNGMRYNVSHHNPLKRPRTPAINDDAQSTTSRNGAISKEEQAAAEERRQAMRKHLYARSERMISKLFEKPSESSKSSQGAPNDAQVTPKKDQSTADPTPQTKRSTRVIDEEDYGDDDDDEEESSSSAPTTQLKTPITPAPTSHPTNLLSAHSLKPSLDRGSTTSSTEHGKSAENVRKRLEEEKKAAENAVRESFLNTFYTLENDRDAMLEQQKLDELDRQVENEMRGQNGEGTGSGRGGQNQGTLSSANLGVSSLTLKHLIARIDAKRHMVSASDATLRSLMSEVRRNRSKWANEEKIGQEELYEAAERVLMELKSMSDYVQPFLQRVNKRDVPDYHRIIHEPMDIGTMIKKLKSLSYKSKREFCRDLDLIWTNCFKYNADPNHSLYKKAEYLRKETAALTPLIPDITIRDRAEVEAEERRAQYADDDSDDDEPIVATRGRKAPAKTSTKGTGQTRKAPKAPSESSPVPDTSRRTHSVGPSGMAHGSRQEQLRSDADSMVDGMSITPPPGNSTPLDVAGQSDVGASSHVDGDDGDGSAMAHQEELDEEDEEYKVWRQITKKDRARVAAERHQLFKQDKLNPEEPALLRTRAGMRRWSKQQKTLLGNETSLEGTESQGKDNNEESNAGATLAENMDVDDTNLLPDYYDPLSGIPHLNDRLQWTEDSEGQIIDQKEECLRVLPKGYFTAPDSSLSAKMTSNMQQMQDTRKIVSKISMVKQMSLQTQTYQNQFQKYDPAPFVEQDADPQVVSDDSPSISPWICREVLKRTVGKLFYHAGFEEFQPAALDVATDLAGDYFTRLVKTLGVYHGAPKIFEEAPESSATEINNPTSAPKTTSTDTSPSKKRPLEATISASTIIPGPLQKKRKLITRFTPEEEILLTLRENGTDLDTLQTYIDDDISRLGGKLVTQHQRVKDYYAELLRPALDPATTGTDGVGAFTDGSEAQFVAGDFAEDIDEDFFGFKELGLDVEFGISAASVPLHLLQSRVRNSAYQPNAPNANGESANVIEPPPPYPSLTADDIPKMIGLVQSFFQERLERSDGDVILEDDDLPRKERFPKPRLPPSGKISSPRKRPIREQQQMARRKKKAEAEATRELERLKEAGINGNPDTNVKPENTNATQDTTSASGALHVNTADGDAKDNLTNETLLNGDSLNANDGDQNDDETPDTPTRRPARLASPTENDVFKIPEPIASASSINGNTDPEKKQPQSTDESSTKADSALDPQQEHQLTNGVPIDDKEPTSQLTNGNSEPNTTHPHKDKGKPKDASGEDGDKAEPAADNDEDADTQILSPSESLPIAAH